MDMKLLIIFIILNVVNVVIQTVKSLATIKCGKATASVVNAVAYGLYTVVVVYTVCDLPLWLKVLVVAVANLIGVYIVKWLEEKSRKDKLWKVEVTLPSENLTDVLAILKKSDIPCNYIENVGKYVLLNIYCATQNESAIVKNILTMYNAKYFVTESKIL